MINEFSTMCFLALNEHMMNTEMKGTAFVDAVYELRELRKKLLSYGIYDAEGTDKGRLIVREEIFCDLHAAVVLMNKHLRATYLEKPSYLEKKDG